MSGDQDARDPAAGQEDIEQVMREAEQAVDKVRDETDPAEGGEAPGPGTQAEANGETSPEAQLEQLRAELETTRDKWLRAVADLDNYKKRVKRDIDDANLRAVQGLLSAFLPVGDNLERALSAVAEDADEQLVKGIEMVRQEFHSALTKHGIEAVDSVGKAFDPSVHDALQQIDSPDHPPGVVVMEYEKGYVRSGKLLRPARVIVAGPGSTGVAPDAGGSAEEAN